MAVAYNLYALVTWAKSVFLADVKQPFFAIMIRIVICVDCVRNFYDSKQRLTKLTRLQIRILYRLFIVSVHTAESWCKIRFVLTYRSLTTRPEGSEKTTQFSSLLRFFTWEIFSLTCKYLYHRYSKPWRQTSYSEVLTHKRRRNIERIDREMNHPLKAILLQRSQNLCRKLSKVYL